MQLLAALEDPHPTAAYILLAMMLLSALLYAAFWIWMLVDAICYEPPGSVHRIAWPIVILIFGGLAAFIYNVSRRKQRKKLYGR